MARKNGKGKTSDQIAKETTDRILEALEQDIVPWHKPWSVMGGHFSYASRKPYRGINQFLLEITAILKGYSSRWWMTYGRAAQESEKLDPENYTGVRKGEKGTIVVLLKPIIIEDKNNLDENGKPTEKQIWYYREMKVFNIEQTDLPHPPEGENDFAPIEEAQRVIDDLVDLPKLKHGGDEAYYLGMTDRVTVPLPETFESPESYYSTVYHEYGHATGHETRLNRPGVTEADSRKIEQYSQEELIAEMTAAMVCGFVGIEVEARTEHSAAYIDHYLKVLKQDGNKRLILSTASKAHKAADYILGIEQEAENNE